MSAASTQSSYLTYIRSLPSLVFFDSIVVMFLAGALLPLSKKIGIFLLNQVLDRVLTHVLAPMLKAEGQLDTLRNRYNRLKQVLEDLQETGHVNAVTLADDIELLHQCADIFDTYEVKHIPVFKRLEAASQCDELFPKTVQAIDRINNWKVLSSNSPPRSQPSSPCEIDHMKRILLYFSLFPLRFEITAKQLFLMWDAERFFLPKQVKINTVQRYLKDLVDMNMVQEIRRQKQGKPAKFVNTYSLATFTQELFIEDAHKETIYVVDLRDVRLVEDVEEATVSLDLSHGPKITRLSVLLGEGEPGRLTQLVGIFEKKGVCLKSLRTLILLGGKEERQKTCWKEMDKLFKKCGNIRVLKVEGFESMQGTVPRSMIHLHNLKFLSFKNTRVECLSAWPLQHLQKLETLDLRGSCTPTCPAKVANVLHKMKSLIHLYLPLYFDTPNNKKLRLRGPKELKTLKNFNPSKCEFQARPTLQRTDPYRSG